MSGEGGLQNGGNGGSGDLTQELTQIKNELDQIKKQNEELGGAKESLERQLGDANKELMGEDYLEYLESRKGGKGKEEGSEFSAGEDFDRATNTEVAKFVVGHIDKKLSSVMDDVNKRSKALDDKIGLAFAKLDVSLAKNKFDGNDGGPAWSDHEKEIFEIAKKNPSWGAEQCYRQFKLEHLARTEEERKAAAKKAEEEEKLVTEKGGVPGSATQEKDMSSKEAAEVAYRKAFGNKSSND